MPSIYDVFPYRSYPRPQSHPDRLCLISRLFGMSPAPPTSCRVLEIGCADGGNLVPMAEALPNAHFVGVDLSNAQVEAGRQWVAPLQLDNLELVAGDGTDMPELGPFDYIVCHGVYSWIDAPQRKALLAAISRHLAHNGVAYVSYNIYPGWHTRQWIRDFILQHVAETTDPHERVEGARSMLRFLAGATNPDSAHGALVLEQCQSILSTSPQYLLHGLLADVNAPCYFQDFLQEAGGTKLAYLGDAEFGTMLGTELHEAAQREVAAVPGGLVAQEQVQDYLTHRSFRQSLLVHESTTLDRTIPWSRTTGTWVSGRKRSSSDSNDPIWEHALHLLSVRWPAQWSMEEWVTTVAADLAIHEEMVRTTLGRKVLDRYARRVIDLHPRDLGIAYEPPPFPKITRWAQQQLALEQLVADLRHGFRKLPPLLAVVAHHCDGHHDHEALVAVVEQHAERGTIEISDTPTAATQRALDGLAVRALLLK